MADQTASKTRTEDNPDAEVSETTQFLQLVYASAAREPFTEDELIELLDKARRNNEALNVTGMLLYHEGSFIQVLEGDADIVEALYDKIALDSRHINAMLLYKGFSHHRNFGGWTMGFERLSLAAHAELPGLSRFLQSGVLALRSDDGGNIRRTLIGFRDGKYHRG